MKASRIILGIVMIVLGIALIMGILAATGFKFSELGNSEPVTNEYKIDKSFKKISIDVDTADVELLPATDRNVKLVCKEDKKVQHTYTVEDGTLKITVKDDRNWFDHIGMYTEKMKLTLYLPAKDYEALKVKTDTGDIEVPKDFHFGQIALETDTGDVELLAPADGAVTIENDTGRVSVSGISADALQISNNTGRINVGSVTVKKAFKAEADTGRMELTDVTCASFDAEEDTGDITLKNVIVSGTMTIKSDTGDVRFEDSDAEEIKVKTSTGDVTGTLLTGKIFSTDTSTGKVSVPATSGGLCEIKTSTGDIKIEVKGK